MSDNWMDGLTTYNTLSTKTNIASAVEDYMGTAAAISATAAIPNESKINTLEKSIDELTKKPEVSPDTTTKLDIKHKKIYVKHYKDGFSKNERYLIPDITDVKVHHNTVLVTFADDTKTVAVLDNEDKFNLEQGISICITKKLLGESGSSIYNKLIKRALKVKKQNEQAAAKKEKEKVEVKKRKAAALKRHQKKKAKRRGERISEMAEAYIRAIEHFKENI
jgi:hypothetical protein